MKKILAYVFGIIMILSGIAHILSPEAYTAMIPDFIPAAFANISAALVESFVGVMLILPKYRKKGALFFAGLMIAFMPIHIWDLFRETPAIGPPPAPIIRLVVQLLLIYVGWWLHKKYK